MQVLLRVFPPASILIFVEPTAIPGDNPGGKPSQAEIDEESRRIRRLRILVHLTLDTISSGDLPPEEASAMIAATRRAALAMFPGKENAFDLIYRPQFQRLMNAVYRLQ
ncbi:MAG TPA: hypothetical protein VMU43_00435 [Candidatus Acidoferrum sp.]|nr:hypothetical protein [Candidatus Acidoferrum sp.]